MSGSLHIYITPAGWLTPEIDPLIRQLLRDTPESIKIIASNTELKQAIIDRYAYDAPIQSYPQILTLDDCVTGASGITVRRSPLLESAARRLALSVIEARWPELVPLIDLPGIWSRLDALAESRTMNQTNSETITKIARQWFGESSHYPLEQVLTVIDTSRDEVGIRDQRFAYRYCRREQWTPLTHNADTTTIILIGFSDPMISQQAALLSLIARARLSIVPIARSPYPSQNGDQWIAALRAVYAVQEIELPHAVPHAKTHIWTPESLSDSNRLIVTLSGLPGKTGIALSDFDGAKYSMANTLRHAGLSATIVSPIRLIDTPPGMILDAAINGIQSRFMIRDVLRWLEVRLTDAPRPEYSIDDIEKCRNRLVIRGLIDTDAWPRHLELGMGLPIQTMISQLIALSPATISASMRSVQTMLQNHPSEPDQSQWSGSPTLQWGALLQLLNEWETLIPKLPGTDHLSLLRDGLSRTSVPQSTPPGEIRICSLQHAAVVPVDRWIIPNATDRAWLTVTHPLGPLNIPSAPEIPDLDDHIAAYQRYLEGIIGMAANEIHIIAPQSIDSEPQTVSGIVTATLASAQIAVTQIFPNLPPIAPDVSAPPPRDPVAPPPPESYSASQLESYQKCPRNYMMSRLLRATPIQRRDIDLGPDEHGQLLHQIIGQLLLHLQSTPSSLGDHDRAIQWMETAALVFIHQVRGESLGSTIHRRWMGSVERPGLLRLALPDILEFLHDYELTDVEREFEFKPSPNGPIIRGRIDLIARHRESRKIVILDIKTGIASISKVHLETLEHLQLPIYRLALQQEGISVAAGQIWSINRPKIERKTVMVDELSKSIFVAKRQQPLILSEDYDSRVIQRIQWIISMIESGQFPVSGIPELSRQEAARAEQLCKRCEFIQSCPFENRFY